MINSNILRAVGEAFEAHHITARPGEQFADTVARALHVSASEAARWLEALNSGCTVAEANRKAGINTHKDNDPVLNTLARLIGTVLGTVTPYSGPE